MLVQSRQRDETIRITLEDGRTIDVVVVEIRSGTTARLGVTADRSIRVDRLEVWESKRREAEALAAAGAK